MVQIIESTRPGCLLIPACLFAFKLIHGHYTTKGDWIKEHLDAVVMRGDEGHVKHVKHHHKHWSDHTPTWWRWWVTQHTAESNTTLR